MHTILKKRARTVGIMDSADGLSQGWRVGARRPVVVAMPVARAAPRALHQRPQADHLRRDAHEQTLVAVALPAAAPREPHRAPDVRRRRRRRGRRQQGGADAGVTHRRGPRGQRAGEEEWLGGDVEQVQRGDGDQRLAPRPRTGGAVARQAAEAHSLPRQRADEASRDVPLGEEQDSAAGVRGKGSRHDVVHHSSPFLFHYRDASSVTLFLYIFSTRLFSIRIDPYFGDANVYLATWVESSAVYMCDP